MASSALPSQILVSDDSERRQAEQTKAICAGFGTVTYVPGPRRGLSANRNACLERLARAIRYVVFIDDDVVVRRNFFRDALCAITRASDNTIITGRECRDGFEVLPHNLSFWGYQEVPPRSGSDYHAIVINSAIFPRTLFSYVRFDDLLRYGSEEIDLCAQAENAGFHIMFNYGLINDHYSSPVNRDEYKKFQEASRLYSTYKRYRWIEQNAAKAVVYATLAPMHLLLGTMKSREFIQIPSNLRSISLAAQYVLVHWRQAGDFQNATN